MQELEDETTNRPNDVTVSEPEIPRPDDSVESVTDNGTECIVEQTVDNNTRSAQEKMSASANDGVRRSSRQRKRPLKFKDYDEVEFDV